MAAGKYSFTIEQGATLNFEIQYKDANGNPLQLEVGEIHEGKVYMEYCIALEGIYPERN